MALFNPPPVHLQPYFGYRSRDRLILSARALRSGKAGFDKRGRLQAMRTMLAQFASREEAGVPVIRDVPLARALNYRADEDELIPEEFFDAVAEVIAWAERVRGSASASDS